jgi:6-pyruvoyltetrahydropterin/6-carboxytetrahydropterin synthase
MHKLCRYVRFSINPFLPVDEPGFNSFASKPAGDGLALFLELGIELEGSVEPKTGLVINVSDIDKKLRDYIIPVFAERIRAGFEKANHIGYYELTELLKITWEKLNGKFGSAKLSRVNLKLDPFRTLAVNEGNCAMVYYSEKFEFAAAHKLWNDKLSEKQNIEVFGKCANPAGHGHNYVIEITVKWPQGQEMKRADFEKVINEQLINTIDHKNLNQDVPQFQKANPTVENIAVFIWGKLIGKFSQAILHCVTVWENDRTYSSYYG